MFCFLQVRGHDVVSEILFRLPLLYKKEWQGESMLPSILTSLDLVFNLSNLELLVRFADSLRQGNQQWSCSASGDSSPVSVLITALQHPIGSSVLWSLVSRGEHVFTHHDLVDMDLAHQHAWYAFINF